jgi:hypothetical protein
MADNTNTTEKEKIDFSAIEKKWQQLYISLALKTIQLFILLI